MQILFTLGHEEVAWQAFGTLIPNLNRPQLWAAADHGKRIGGASPQEILTWLHEPTVRNQRFYDGSVAILVALRHFTVDRDFNEEVVAAIEEFVDEQTTFGDAYEGFYARRMKNANGRTSRRRVGPSRYAGNKEKFKREMKELRANNDVQTLRDFGEIPAPSEYVLFARAYAAWSSGDVELAAEHFETMNKYYELAYDNVMWMLPYFAAAKAATSDTDELTRYLDGFTNNDKRFDWHLSHAFIKAYAGDIDAALVQLDDALNKRPHTEARLIFAPYQWAEACEAIFVLSGDERVRARLLDWARKIQQIMPHKGWAYAIEAQHAKDPSLRRAALGVALFLDRNSTRLRQFSDEEKAAARAHYAKKPRFRDMESSSDQTNAAIVAPGVGMLAGD